MMMMMMMMRLCKEPRLSGQKQIRSAADERPHKIHYGYVAKTIFTTRGWKSNIMWIFVVPPEGAHTEIR
jgi:hypothetical protein